MKNPDKENRRGIFPATKWTVIVNARDGGEATVAEALGDLCRTYWSPIYTFVRSTGRTVHDSEDLTQAFFADLLSRSFLDHVSEDRGKFRCFLLASLKNYLNKDWRKRSAQKRGSGDIPLSLDFARGELAYRQNLSTDATPEHLFERQWVLSLLDAVLDQLDSEYRETGRSKLFEALKGCLTSREETDSYTDIADQMGMSEGAVKVAAHRLKKRYREALKVQISRTLDEGEEVESEWRYLMGVFSR